jgi:hypothetical protein
MPAQTLTVDRFAETLLNGLSEAERKKILATASKLVGVRPENWSKNRVTALPGPEPLYLLRVPPDLCVFIVPTSEGLEIQDVFYEESLRRIGAGQRNGNGAKG